MTELGMHLAKFVGQALFDSLSNCFSMDWAEEPLEEGEQNKHEPEESTREKAPGEELEPVKPS